LFLMLWDSSRPQEFWYCWSFLYIKNPFKEVINKSKDSNELTVTASASFKILKKFHCLCLFKKKLWTLTIRKTTLIRLWIHPSIMYLFLIKCKHSNRKWAIPAK
jgi:hypothetical protein